MKNCFFEGDILIPQNVDMGKWSVVACDQYTSEREYWDDVENIVGDTPSTLRIMLPEIELTGDTTEKIAKINYERLWQYRSFQRAQGQYDIR